MREVFKSQIDFVILNTDNKGEVYILMLLFCDTNSLNQILQNLVR